MRSAYDLSPLLRSTIGFDRINRLFEAANRLDEQAVSFPPYNIEKTSDDKYRITMAVAGFAASQLEVTVKENVLYIVGKAREEQSPVHYLHRGIAARAFERRFDLADTVRVTGASVEDGLLHVDLVREVPEAKKPRHIEIQTRAVSTEAPQIEHQAA